MRNLNQREKYEQVVDKIGRLENLEIAHFQAKMTHFSVVFDETRSIFVHFSQF